MTDAIANMINDGLTWPEAFFLVGLMGFAGFVLLLVGVLLVGLFSD